MSKKHIIATVLDNLSQICSFVSKLLTKKKISKKKKTSKKKGVSNEKNKISWAILSKVQR